MDTDVAHDIPGRRIVSLAAWVGACARCSFESCLVRCPQAARLSRTLTEVLLLLVIGSGQTIVMANGLQWNKVPEECATKGYHLIGLPACAVYPLDGKVPGTWNKEECELAISALLHPEPTQRCTIICTASGEATFLSPSRN